MAAQGQGPGVAGSPRIQVPNQGGVPQMGSPTKEIHLATFCKVGQEMVEDIVSKTTDIFNYLKATHLPNGQTATVQVTQERKDKLQELIRTVVNQFRKLHMVYDKVREGTLALEDRPVQELLPIEVNGEVNHVPPIITEVAKYHSEEQREIVEQIQTRNRQLKEIIDSLRLIIWEINTMMAMRHA